VNQYETVHDAPDARVAPEQFVTALKLASPGAPPANVSTCGDDARLVTTTFLTADASPTTVAGNASVVGAIEKPGVAVPDSEIVPELSPLAVKLVLAECGPDVCGVNVYVTVQEAPAARVAPEQFVTPPKFASPGAPPAIATTCVDADTFVTVTAIPADVPPTAVDGKAIVVPLKPKSGSAWAWLIGTLRKIAVNATTSAARRRAGASIDPPRLSSWHILAVSIISV
jgi:hypothetical protein